MNKHSDLCIGGEKGPCNCGVIAVEPGGRMNKERYTAKLKAYLETYPERYPMGGSQPAQLDCRLTECMFQDAGTCSNVAPSITLNKLGAFICWSKVTMKTLDNPDVW